MKRKKLLLLFLCLTLFLTACSSSYNGSYDGSAAIESSPAYNDGPMADSPNMGFGGGSTLSSGSYYENTKVILTADLSLQTTDFDEAITALDALVTAQNGYYESSEYSYGSYYSSSSEARWGWFTIRIPRAQFQAFLSAVGDVAYVARRTTGTQDVGEAYYDTELRLATLQTKHERLLSLLEQAVEMEDIITLEAALSDVEYQIQQYSSTLTRYDGLIDFATISLDLQEVIRVSDTPAQADPLSARVGAAFTSGWNNFCDGMANLAVWVAYNFMGLLILAAVIVVCIVVSRKLRRTKKALERKLKAAYQEIEESKDKDDKPE